MAEYYLAIDIGASSGRHILTHLEDGKMVLQEIHRFPNGMTEKDGRKVWDIDHLFAEVQIGMKKCAELGKIPVSVGIDTWAVDFVLLGKDGERITDAVAYRDSRTEGMDEKVYEIIPETELYARTGIQKQKFNTIYQLMAMKEQEPELLMQAKTFLMVPDYLHYLLTGVKAVEYTNATSSQLVNPVTKQWDKDLMEMLGYPAEIFPEIKVPGTCLGELTPEMQEKIGYNCKVIAPGTHDTASAVLAVPAEADEDTLYISSGTWSLMGTELMEANCTPEAQKHNFTNEGGYNYRFRFLKNIMGLWMIQSVKKEIGADLSFGEICDQASRETIASKVDCNDDRFLAPTNMTEEVQAACRESGQEVPVGIAQVASVVYNSLAECYGETCREIESLTGKTYGKIRIVGGGANAEYLNELTAKASGKAVYAGPTEGTAIGNLAAQMISRGALGSLEDARACIGKSFPIHIYQ
ncbi:MAG: rhamnulokinase [Clostridiales bacterium]|nr:rhamnulokinase [Clostridiales bacterium]